MPTQSTLPADVNVRAATQTDASIIYDFVCDLEESSLDTTAFNAVFTLNLSNPTIHYLVAEGNGHVLGFVSCHVQHLLHHCGKIGEIQELFVRPDARNQQIGYQLIDALNRLAVEQNFVNLEVTTNQKRAHTIRFYERESFTRTHVKLVKPIQP